LIFSLNKYRTPNATSRHASGIRIAIRTTARKDNLNNIHTLKIMNAQHPGEADMTAGYQWT